MYDNYIASHVQPSEHLQSQKYIHIVCYRVILHKLQYYSYVSVIKTRMGYIDLQVEHCSYNNSRHLSTSGIVYYIEGSVFCLSHHRFKVFIQTYLSKKELEYMLVHIEFGEMY